LAIISFIIAPRSDQIVWGEADILANLDRLGIDERGEGIARLGRAVDGIRRRLGIFVNLCGSVLLSEEEGIDRPVEHLKGAGLKKAEARAPRTIALKDKKGVVTKFILNEDAIRAPAPLDAKSEIGGEGGEGRNIEDVADAGEA